MRRYWRRLGAFLSAIAVFAAIFFLRRHGLFDGAPALAFGILLILLMPSSSNLSRRMLLNGALFLGWVPLLWWVRLPVPQVDRMGIVLAAAAAGLVGWMLWTPDLGSRARRLVPRLTVVDAMPFVAGGLTTYFTWPLISVRDGGRMLGLLIERGYDHVSHFSMVYQTRVEGGVVTTLGLGPDGSPWDFSDYPQHFHAALTSLMDLYDGPTAGVAVRELLLYGRGLAIIQIIIAVLLVAGVAQLSQLRHRPLLAWPVAGVVLGAFVFGPGVWALSAGYPNFVFACATAGLAALLATPMRRELVPLRVFALGGLVVATIHSWALIGPAAIAGALVAFLPCDRSRWPRSWRRRAGLLAALMATAVASIMVVPLLVGSGGGEAMLLGAELNLWVHLGELSLALFTVGAATAVAVALSARKGFRETSQKGIGLAAVLAVTVLFTVGVAIYQLSKAGVLSYYVYKLVSAMPLLSASVLAAALALHVQGPRPVRSRKRTSVAVTASILATVVALNMFGLAGLKYYFSEAPRTLASAGVREEAERVILAADIAEKRPFGTTYYVAALPGEQLPFLLDQWQRSMSMMWTQDAQLRGFVILDAERTSKDGMEPAEVVRVAEELFENGPDIAAVVAREVIDQVRALLPADLRSRVLTW